MAITYVKRSEYGITISVGRMSSVRSISYTAYALSQVRKRGRIRYKVSAMYFILNQLTNVAYETRCFPLTEKMHLSLPGILPDDTISIGDTVKPQRLVELHKEFIRSIHNDTN